MQEIATQFIMWVLSKSPLFGSAIVMLGTFRLIFKPIMSALMQIVDVTETKTDNEMLQKILDSKWYKVLSWVLDYAVSLKTPQMSKSDDKKEDKAA